MLLPELGSAGGLFLLAHRGSPDHWDFPSDIREALLTIKSTLRLL